MVLSNHSILPYCDSNIILFSIAPCKDINLIYDIISLLLSIVIALPTIANALSGRAITSNIEKKPWINVQNDTKKWSKEVKSDVFFIEILENVQIDCVPKIISLFGAPIIFSIIIANCERN